VSRRKHFEPIAIAPYNPAWIKIYEQESGAIKESLATYCLTIHRFCSTSVPGLSAKPKIDILVEIKSFRDLDISVLEALGFEYCKGLI